MPVTRPPRWRGRRGGGGGGRGGRAGGIRTQQVPRDDAEVHLVGAVGQAQASGAGVGGGEREVLAHASAAVQLDGEVDDVAGHLRHGRLDLGHLGLGTRDADGVELPGGVQHEEAGLVDGDPGPGEAFAVAAEVGDRLAEGHPAARALAGELERLLGQPDEAHAVVHPARPEAALGDLERTPRAGEDRAGREAHSAQGDLAVAERLVVLTERGQHPLDGHAGGLERHDDHRVLAVAVRAGVGEAHEDPDLAVGVTGAGGPPLAPVEDDVVAVEGGRGLHVGGVGAGDSGLGHQEGAAHPPVEQRLEPLLLLLGRAVTQQHLHVAGVGSVAVEHQRRQGRAAGHLGDRGVVGVGEPGAAVGAEAGGVRVTVPGREEEVPQALAAGLGLQLADHGGRRPGVLTAGPACGDVAQDAGLDGLDLGVDEGPDAGGEVGGAGGGGEVHGLDPRPLLSNAQ